MHCTALQPVESRRRGFQPPPGEKGGGGGVTVTEDRDKRACPELPPIPNGPARLRDPYSSLPASRSPEIKASPARFPPPDSSGP